MGNLTESYDLNELKRILNKIRKYKVTNEILEELLYLLILGNDGKLLTNYKLKSRKNVPAIFMPQYNCIFLDVQQINDWVLNNMDMTDSFNVEVDVDSLKAYLGLFSIIHEVNHSIQYHIAEGNILGYPKDLNKVYKDILELFIKKDTIIPFSDSIRITRLIIYKNSENQFILERNANIETSRLLYRLSEYEDNRIALLFRKVYEFLVKTGYSDKYDGTIQETYLRLLMKYKYNKLEFDDDLSIEEKRRYGLPLVKKR